MTGGAGEGHALLGDQPYVLGGNVFGWTATVEESVAVLDAYAARGGTMIDTADVYSAWVPGNTGGESERIIGDWMAGRDDRDRLLVATKVGQLPESPGLSRDSIRRGLDASLERLRTDRVDVFYAHFDDRSTPLEETARALDELVREGTVRRLAVSNYDADRLAALIDVQDREGLTPLTYVQVHYHLLRRRYEHELRPLLAGRGTAVLTYYSLAQGFLTGKYRTTSPGASDRSSAALRYLDDRGFAVLDALDEVAARHAVPLAAVALAWLGAQPTVAAPVASARTLAQLDGLEATRGLVLSDDDLGRLDAASGGGDA